MNILLGLLPLILDVRRIGASPILAGGYRVPVSLSSKWIARSGGTATRSPPDVWASQRMSWSSSLVPFQWTRDSLSSRLRRLPPEKRSASLVEGSAQ